MNERYKVVTWLLMVWILLPLTGTVASARQTAGEAYRDAREHLIEERYEQALALFRRVVDEYSDSDRADDAQYYIGYTLEAMGRNQEAIQAFEEVLENWPDSSRVESARLHRNELLGRQPGRGQGVYEEVIRSSGSWELRRDTSLALARQGNLAGADVLEEIMRRGSSSRQLELVKILGRRVEDPVARGIIIIGLEPSHSSSVQLRTLQTLQPVVKDREVIRAIQGTLTRETSSSVKLKAIEVLRGFMDDAGVRRAMTEALGEGNSSSVKITACAALSGHLLDPEVRPALLRLFEGSSSSSVQLKALEELEREKDRPEIAEALRAAMARHNSSSVKLKAMRIAGGSGRADVRAVARAGLGSGSSSVQLSAVKALAEGLNDPAASEAIEEVFRSNDVSTSVQVAALGALSRHMETDAAPRALALALTSRNSTRVQLRAMELASQYIGRPEVKGGVLQLLDDSSTSTSVQLRAIRMLQPAVDIAEVRGIVSAALRPSNSTSVQLQAVEALSPQSRHEDVRRALVSTLDRDYSTSVVLKSLRELDDYVDEDPQVREAFIRVMQNHRMSSTVRVRAAEELVSVADSKLEEQIADAMEDVIIRLSRNRGRSGDLLDDAFDVLEDVDPERAERLEDRRRRRRSYLWRGGEWLAENTGLGEVWRHLDTLKLLAELTRGGSQFGESARSAVVELE